MRLLSMRLHNFRQFEGSTPKLEFAQHKQNNVTVVFGSNGAGKTALLNALTWSFFGKFTDALALPEQLVNRRAIANATKGSTVCAWVEVMFEHTGNNYRLKRSKSVVRGSEVTAGTSQEEEVTLDVGDPTGHWQAVKQNDVLDRLGTILPSQLHSYFFFDGERIERLQRPDKRAEITSATALFTGEELLRRASSHLGEAAKRFESELRILGDVEQQKLIDRKQTVEERKEQLHRQEAQNEANLKGYTNARDAVEAELRKLETVKAQQAIRDHLINEQERLRQSMATSRLKLADLVSNRGYWPFLGGGFNRFLAIVSGLESRGELPTPMKAPFVQSLLDKGECICGRSLVPDDSAYQQVEAWMHRSGLSSIEEVAIRMRTEVERLQREMPDLYADIQYEKNHREQARDQLSRVEEKLALIGAQLRGSPEANVRELQSRLDSLAGNIREVQLQQLEDRRNLETVNGEIEKLEDEIRKVEAKTAQQALAMRRLGICREARAVIEEVRRRLEAHFRTDLAARISRIFALLSFKAYKAVLSPDYTLGLSDGTGGPPVGMSTGESQALSLSFIGAIIENAREFAASREGLPGPDSSAFPLVMDSPFGNLDPLYRQQICRHIPELADQVVIFVNRSQWEGDVAHSLETRIGKEYVLSYYSPKPDAQEDSILRFGATYSLVKHTGDDFERTDIVEVVRGHR
ncbi:MAG TPA: AAA family ATPase [Dissulfurispiraceae bacterium]|nr:AAA family ATPase [Dissulfurispiraceae bacterium]